MKLKPFILLLTISILPLLAGCSKEQFWGEAQISRPGSNASAADAFAAKDTGDAELTAEKARKYLESGIARLLEASTYNIKVTGKIDWKRRDQTLKILDYSNLISFDRNEKCFRQDWSVKDTGSKDKPFKGSTAGTRNSIYFTGASGKWEQGNPQLFSVIFTNLDSVIKHLNSIQLHSIEKTYIEKGFIVIEAQLEMDAENAAASRGLFSTADIELSSLKVNTFAGRIKLYIRQKDALIAKEELTGRYNIDGEDCPVNIKTEIDKINETIDLKLPSYVLDIKK